MVVIYILKLEQGKYYVGKTCDLIARLQAHYTGSASEWTKRYPVISLENWYPDCSDYDEDKYTLMTMAAHGINNVRGGSWCALDLSQETIAEITQRLRSANDKCLRCGSSEHFVADCKAEEKAAPAPAAVVCFKCGVAGHYGNACCNVQDESQNDEDEEEKSRGA